MARARGYQTPNSKIVPNSRPAWKRAMAHLVFLVGPPGSGKTTLLRSLVESKGMRPHQTKNKRLAWVSDGHSVVFGRWRGLHEDPQATPADRNLVEQIRRNYRSFLAESAYCDAMGDYCDGRLCRCKRRTGRHLCYKMNLLWQQDCHVPSKVLPCEDPSVTEVKDMCSVMEKLPGVNVDSWLLSPKTERGEPVQEAPTFFFAPEGVYE